MNISDFGASLPRSVEIPPIMDETRGLAIIEEVQKDFVPPNLVEREGSNSEAEVVLIVAPAAAGKSTCARAMAAISGALFADLSSRRVADGSFLGLLQEGLNSRGALTFTELLQDNHASIVMDSLDEAHITSGEMNFVAFVQGICRFSRGSSGQGNIVMLSRLDTADWVTTTFEQEGLPLRQLTLDYFNKPEAEEFINLKLDNLYRERGFRRAPHRQHVVPFDAARAMVFDRVAAGLAKGKSDYWEDPDLRRFLGYSPVLETIAGYLLVPDHNSLLQEMENPPLLSDGTAPEWQVLRSLIESLLNREQRKFIKNYWTGDRSGQHPTLDAARVMYSPAEQCIRLVTLIELKRQRTDLPLMLPSDLRSSYQDSIGSQLREHPFITSRGEYVSSAFKDYMFAYVLSSPEVDLEVTDVVLEQLRSQESLPSPALAPFIVELSTSAKGRLFLADKCDLLIGSLYSQEDDSLHYQFTIGSSGDEEITLHVRKESADSSNQFLQVPLLMGARALRLPMRCRDLLVDVEGDVELDAPGRIIKIGPNTHITCTSIVIAAQSLFVQSQKDDGVSLQAGLVVSDYNLAIRVFGPEKFIIIADDVEGSLRSYRVDPSIFPTEDLWEAFHTLRRLLTFFRKTVHVSKGRLSAGREEVERYVLRRNRLASRLVESFKRDGLITEDGESLVINIDALSRQGVNHEDIRSLRATPTLLEFLKSHTES
jgi:hypothetical protein